jgi:CopG family nickel-responsive transcriptional regulator
MVGAFAQGNWNCRPGRDWRRTMPEVIRFTVSAEEDLLGQFDEYCQQEKFATRSEAVRQLIRDRLTNRGWETGSHAAAGTLTLVYDHHHAQVGKRLTRLQHANTDLIVSTTHVHLTHELCLEVIILRGPANRLQEVAAQLKGLKGIHKGELVVASAQDP